MALYTVTRSSVDGALSVTSFTLMLGGKSGLNKTNEKSDVHTPAITLASVFLYPVLSFCSG